jgi:Flp pilus assembly pilin Flp
MKLKDVAGLRRFLEEESGQDIVEYALLTALIGIAAILTWQVVADSVGVAYGQSDTDVQALGAFTPDPQ